MSESSAEFRDVVRELRDEERAPLDAMQVSSACVLLLAFRSCVQVHDHAPLHEYCDKHTCNAELLNAGKSSSLM